MRDRTAPRLAVRVESIFAAEIGVGPGKVQKDGSVRPLSLKVGDRVMFSKYGPTEIKVDDEELLVLEESDIIALIED